MTNVDKKDMGVPARFSKPTYLPRFYLPNQKANPPQHQCHNPTRTHSCDNDQVIPSSVLFGSGKLTLQSVADTPTYTQQLSLEKHIQRRMKEAHKGGHFDNTKTRHQIILVDDNTLPPHLVPVMKFIVGLLHLVHVSVGAASTTYFTSYPNREVEQPDADRQFVEYLERLRLTASFSHTKQMIDDFQGSYEDKEEVKKYHQARSITAKSDKGLAHQLFIKDTRKLLSRHQEGWPTEDIIGSKFNKLYDEALDYSREQPQELCTLVCALEKSIQALKTRLDCEATDATTITIVIATELNNVEVGHLKNLLNRVSKQMDFNSKDAFAILALVPSQKAFKQHKALDNCNTGRRDMYEALEMTNDLCRGPGKDYFPRVHNSHTEHCFLKSGRIFRSNNCFLLFSFLPFYRIVFFLSPLLMKAFWRCLPLFLSDMLICFKIIGLFFHHSIAKYITFSLPTA